MRHLPPAPLQAIRIGRSDPCGCGSRRKFADCHYRAVRKSGAQDYAEYQRREKLTWLAGTLLRRADDYREALQRQVVASTEMVLADVLRDLRVARESLADATAKVSGATDLQILTHTEFTLDEMLESIGQIDSFVGDFQPQLVAKEASALQRAI